MMRCASAAAPAPAAGLRRFALMRSSARGRSSPAGVLFLIIGRAPACEEDREGVWFALGVDPDVVQFQILRQLEPFTYINRRGPGARLLELPREGRAASAREC